jgi:hypothetical protein
MTGEKIISAADFQKHPRWFNALNSVWSKAYARGSSPFFQKDELMMGAGGLPD